jgi:PAS domain S-box-containing protein
MPERSGGEIGRLIAERDWRGSPLGTPDQWPPELRNAVRLVLPAKVQIVLFWGDDYVALYNDAYAPAIGDKHPAAFGRPAREFLSELWDDLEPLLRRVRETGEAFAAKDRPFYIERHGYGEEVLFDISYSPVRDEAGVVKGVLCIVDETTARVIDRARLQFQLELGDKLRALSDPEAIMATAAELLGQRLGVDRAGYAELYEDEGHFAIAADWTAEGVASTAGVHSIAEYGEPVMDAFRAGRIFKINDARTDPEAEGVREAFAQVSVGAGIAVPLLKEGHCVAVLHVDSARPRRWTDSDVAMVEVAAERTWAAVEQAKAEAALQRLAQSLEQEVAARTAERDRIWRVSNDLLGVADLNGVWRSVNPAWKRALGWAAEQIVGRTSAWIGHPDDRDLNREQAKKLAAGARRLAFEHRLRTREGDYRTLSWTMVVEEEALYCTGRDVTAERERQKELDEVQERLRQSQKMETVGQLTGGVAHDFNNLLQVIAGNLDLLLRTLPEDASRQRRAAERAMSGARRAATLTERLLAFSRRQPLSPKPLNANRLISGMSELLHRSLGETVEIEVVLSPSLWRAELDPNALENAILNLAVNARDAMPEGGKLTIETANTHLDRDYVAQHPELSAGQYVSISVSDTGHGMAPEVVERVFEPFFTTKEVGKGTGLGLSMVYGFIKQSGGHVKLYSEPGQGTTVRLYLPRLVGDEAEEIEAPSLPLAERAREETILVCEDDPDVRAFSAEVLRELGYTVCEAVDGPSALRLLQREDGHVDLLFTDVVLPGGMSGSALADEARRTRPGVKVLFTTGYARNAIVHHGRLDPGVELITKPFSYSDLAGRVRDLLDAPRHK